MIPASGYGFSVSVPEGPGEGMSRRRRIERNTRSISRRPQIATVWCARGRCPAAVLIQGQRAATRFGGQDRAAECDRPRGDDPGGRADTDEAQLEHLVLLSARPTLLF